MWGSSEGPGLGTGKNGSLCDGPGKGVGAMWLQVEELNLTTGLLCLLELGNPRQVTDQYLPGHLPLPPLPSRAMIPALQGSYMRGYS